MNTPRTQPIIFCLSLSLVAIAACESSSSSDSGAAGPATTGASAETEADTSAPATSTSSTPDAETTADPEAPTTGAQPETSTTGMDPDPDPDPETEGEGETEPRTTTSGDPTDCVDADIAEAVGAGVASGTTVGGSNDFQLAVCLVDDIDFPVPPGPDYVVSWTPAADGVYTIDTKGSSTDTVLSIVQPECGGDAILCNDDCNDVQSSIAYEATAGETVYIVVEGFGGRAGSFILNIAEGDSQSCDEGGTGGFGTGSGGIDETDTAGT